MSITISITHNVLYNKSKAIMDNREIAKLIVQKVFSTRNDWDAVDEVVEILDEKFTERKREALPLLNKTRDLSNILNTNRDLCDFLNTTRDFPKELTIEDQVSSIEQ